MIDRGRISDPHLRQLMADLVTTTEWARTLTEALTDAQRNWRPRPGAWSVTECMAHLMTTGDIYYPRVREAVNYARENGLTATHSYRPGLMARMFLRLVDPGSRVRLRTFRVFTPQEHTWEPTLMPRFLRQQNELASIIRDADGYELNRVRFMSPASRFLRFSIGEGLDVLVRHQQRHVHQAEARRSLAGFPDDNDG